LSFLLQFDEAAATLQDSHNVLISMAQARGGCQLENPKDMEEDILER
jgi:hypothetical protein